MCLGILSLGQASGYEIKKELEEGPLSFLFDAGFGSIYPALKKLQSDDLIKQVQTPDGGRTDAKYYAITDIGTETLIQALQKKKSKDKIKSPIMFAMFLGHLLPDETLTRMTQEYLHHYQDYYKILKEWQSSDSDLSPSQKYIMAMGEAVITAKLKFIEENSIEDYS